MTRPAFLALLQMALLPLPTYADTGFKVEGVLEYWKWKDKAYELKESCLFEASALNDHWLQSTTLPNGQKLIHGSDGRDVYWLLVDDRSGVKAYPGNVFVGTYPTQAVSVWNTLPWLA